MNVAMLVLLLRVAAPATTLPSRRLGQTAVSEPPQAFEALMVKVRLGDAVVLEPPGADCAPRCIGPELESTTEFATEAAVRVTFDAQGVRSGPVDAGSDALPGRVISTVPAGECR